MVLGVVLAFGGFALAWWIKPTVCYAPAQQTCAPVPAPVLALAPAAPAAHARSHAPAFALVPQAKVLDVKPGELKVKNLTNQTLKFFAMTPKFRNGKMKKHPMGDLIAGAEVTLPCTNANITLAFEGKGYYKEVQGNCSVGRMVAN